ncbi:MAG: hypothetical protein IT383_10325 [Deltaproteobacteria bacterium]|nr:hypothetical protein [Deltaproteobacteria bacterium]
MRHCLLAALLFASLCCCQKAANKAPPLPASPDPALQGAMWSMARNTSALAELLGTAAAPSEAELGQARRLVDEVHATASALAADANARAHPVLGAGLPTFLAEVQAAKRALEQAPPDVEPAKRLGASCRGCHGVAARVLTDDTRLAAR